MPKIVTREYDNSTTGILSSSNFTVVVPGYMGTPASGYDPADLEIGGFGVYKLTSQAEFLNYVGKHAGKKMDAAAPTLEIGDESSTSITKYLFTNKITLEQFLGDYADKVYTYETVASTDPDYGKNGKLLKTEGTDPNAVTYRFIKVNSVKDITWTANVAQGSFCVLDSVGNDAVSDNHIGNQIAYNLLGLGYTVLFKAIDPAKSAIQQLSDASFWEPLKDKSIFNFRYVMSGGCYDAAVMNQIAQLANFDNKVTLETAETVGNSTGRGDIIALCDIDETGVSGTTTASIVSALSKNIGKITGNKYTAIFGPRVVYNMTVDSSFGNNVTFPASFHYLACAAHAFEKYAEWYAVAGYTRGISSYSVDRTTIALGEVAINTLAPRIANDYATKAVNLILKEHNSYYLWGNRTAEPLNASGLTFSHFLNIRQLCCTIKQDLYTALRQFTFDPNSDLLWINFVNTIRPTLEAMKADQGIRGYKLTRVINDKKALLTAKIRIVPIEAVEDFDISIYLEDSLAGIVMTANEEEAE
jgi:hypothetical protein